MPRSLSRCLVPVLTPFTPGGSPMRGFVASDAWLLDQAPTGSRSSEPPAKPIDVGRRAHACSNRLIASGVPAERLMPGAGACSGEIGSDPDPPCGEGMAWRRPEVPPFYYKGMDESGCWGASVCRSAYPSGYGPYLGIVLRPGRVVQEDIWSVRSVKPEKTDTTQEGDRKVDRPGVASG